jgi:hypothetical protein
MNPPRTETARPRYETPPLVPLGTDWNVRMWNGREGDRIPSSDASVSARQVEKCLSVRISSKATGMKDAP